MTAAPTPQPAPLVGTRPVTLRDVAREAGTSPSTASRALSGRGYVAADVRERLLSAADRLGYVANASARTLKQRTSRTVGVVVPALENQFYATLASGIEETLRGADYQMVLISDNGDKAQELAGARTFQAGRRGRSDGPRPERGAGPPRSPRDRPRSARPSSRRGRTAFAAACAGA